MVKDWFRGPIFCGLVDAKKVEKEIPMGITQFSAYEVFGRMLKDGEKELFKRLLSVFFIKEQTTMIALLHKFYAEKYYPQLETNFDGTINASMQALLAAVATANGDYEYSSTLNSAANGGGNNSNIDFGALSGQILKMFFGSMANTVDPTWKTDWFLPGPFTPFGVVAKLLDENGDIFKSSTKSATSYQNTPPTYCDDAYDEQVAYFDIKANNKTTQDVKSETEP